MASLREVGASVRRYLAGLLWKLGVAASAARASIMGGSSSRRPRGQADGGERGGAATGQWERWNDAENYDPLEGNSSNNSEGLKSMESRFSTHIMFQNSLDEVVRIYWVNYDGQHVRYKTLAPKMEHRQQTFESHPWTFMTVASPRRRLVVNGAPVLFPSAEENDHDGQGENRRLAKIERPKLLAWTPENHWQFPRQFKVAVQTVLLCHKRLQEQSPRPSPHHSRSPSASSVLITASSSTSSIHSTLNSCVERCGGCGCSNPGNGPCDGVDCPAETGAVSARPATHQRVVESHAAVAAAAGKTATVPKTTLGDLPEEIVAQVVRMAAPVVPIFIPVASIPVPNAGAPGGAVDVAAAAAGDGDGHENVATNTAVPPAE